MIKLTASDLKLLEALQADSTINQLELADYCGLSRTSLWRRMRELEDAGVIRKRVALLEPRAMGLQIHVLLAVSMVAHSENTATSFETYVMDLPEVIECYSVSGDRDYVLLVVSRDMESYNEFLNTRILHHPSVQSASSSFALRRIKYSTELPFGDAV